MTFNVGTIRSNLAKVGEVLGSMAKQDANNPLIPMLQDLHNIYAGYADLLNYFGGFLSQKYVDDLKFSKDEKETFTEYLATIGDLLTTVQHNNLFEDLLTDPTTEPLQVMQTIERRLQQQEKQLTALVLLEDKMSAIGEKYQSSAEFAKLKIKDPEKQQQLRAFFNPSEKTANTKPNFPFLVKYPYRFMQQFLEICKFGQENLIGMVRAGGITAELEKATNSVDATTRLLEQTKLTIDVQRAVNVASKEVHTSKNLTKAILDFDLTFATEERPLDEQTYAACFDAYVKQLLVDAYPSNFKFDAVKNFSLGLGSPLIDPNNPGRVLAIKNALGFKSQDQLQLVINPAQFNAKDLDILFAQDQNPLWLSLKSTIPVSENFTAKDKINTYLVLADQFFKGTIVPKDKYKGAMDMAEAAAKVVAAANVAGTSAEEVARLSAIVNKAFKFEQEVDSASYPPKKFSAQDQLAPWIAEKNSRAKGIPRQESNTELSVQLQKIMSGSGLPERVSRSSSSSSLLTDVKSSTATSTRRSSIKSDSLVLPASMEKVFANYDEEMNKPEVNGSDEVEKFGFPDDSDDEMENSSTRSSLTQAQMKKALDEFKKPLLEVNFHNQTIPIILENINQRTFPFLFSVGEAPFQQFDERPNSMKASVICTELLSQLEQEYVTPGKESKFQVTDLSLSLNHDQDDQVSLLVEFLDNDGANSFVSYEIDANTGIVEVNDMSHKSTPNI